MTERSAKTAAGIFLAANLAWLAATSARHVVWVDSGELATACATLGIAHPTGYPLYTLLGRTANVLYPGSAIAASVLLSVLAGFAAGVVLVFLLASLIRRCGFLGESGSYSILVAAPAVTLLFYNPISWSLIATNEVYPLHLLFAAILTYLLITGKGLDQAGMFRRAALVGFVLGLSFAHHMSTSLLLIPLAFVVFAERSIRRNLTRMLKWALPTLALGLTVYLYLPIRAAQGPLMNWGDPATFENLVRHVSGWQYRSWMFNKSFGEYISSAGDLIGMTVGMFPLILVLPSIIGAIVMTIRDRIAAIFLILLFASNLLYTAGYTIPEIDTYLLPEVFVYSVFAAIGTIWIVRYVIALLQPRQMLEVKAAAASLLLLAVGGWMIAENEEIAARDDYAYAHTQSRVLAENMDRNAVFLTSNWDLYSPLLYHQHIEGFRTDITSIDVELLRRSWYYKYLMQADSALYARIEPNVDRLLPLLRKFERDEPYSVNEIEDAYQSIITAVARTDNRPVYVDIATRFRDSHQLTRIPEGLAFRILRRNESYEPKPPQNLSIGNPSPELLEFDYSLAKQVQLAETMESEWRSFWQWYRDQPDTATSSSR